MKNGHSVAWNLNNRSEYTVDQIYNNNTFFERDAYSYATTLNGYKVKSFTRYIKETLAKRDPARINSTKPFGRFHINEYNGGPLKGIVQQIEILKEDFCDIFLAALDYSYFSNTSSQVKEYFPYCWEPFQDPTLARALLATMRNGRNQVTYHNLQGTIDALWWLPIPDVDVSTDTGLIKNISKMYVGRNANRKKLRAFMYIPRVVVTDSLIPDRYGIISDDKSDAFHKVGIEYTVFTDKFGVGTNIEARKRGYQGLITHGPY